MANQRGAGDLQLFRRIEQGLSTDDIDGPLFLEENIRLGGSSVLDIQNDSVANVQFINSGSQAVEAKQESRATSTTLHNQTAQGVDVNGHPGSKTFLIFGDVDYCISGPIVSSRADTIACQDSPIDPARRTFQVEDSWLSISTTEQWPSDEVFADQCIDLANSMTETRDWHSLQGQSRESESWSKPKFVEYSKNQSGSQLHRQEPPGVTNNSSTSRENENNEAVVACREALEMVIEDVIDFVTCHHTCDGDDELRSPLNVQDKKNAKGPDYSSPARRAADYANTHLYSALSNVGIDSTRDQLQIANEVIGHSNADEQHLSQPSGQVEMNRIFVNTFNDKYFDSSPALNMEGGENPHPAEEMSDSNTLVPTYASCSLDGCHRKRKPVCKCCIVM